MKRQIVRFSITFLVCIAVSAISYVELRGGRTFDPLMALNAQVSSSMLNWLGESTRTIGNTILSAKLSFEVSSECTSIVPTAILACGVIAWPSKPSHKLAGVVLGGLGLFVVNLIRITSLYYIGTARPELLDIAHYFVWQGLVVLSALGIWVLWVDRIASPHHMVTRVAPE